MIVPRCSRIGNWSARTKRYVRRSWGTCLEVFGEGLLRTVRGMIPPLSEERMPEAEVALRLAFFLLDLPRCSPSIEVNIDGAQVAVGHETIFPLQDFLVENSWTQILQKGSKNWQGIYRKKSKQICVKSDPGLGDVVASIGGKRLRAECKKGPLVKTPGSREYKALWELFGQLLTVAEIEPKDILIGAVPFSDKFQKLVDDWKNRPLVVESGIKIVLVGRKGEVKGIEFDNL